MSDQHVTIVSFDLPERASALQGKLKDSAHPCELLSCEQWLSTAAKSSQSALLFYFGRGMPAPSDVNRMHRMASGQKWRAVFEGPRPTKLPRSFLLPPRYFLWPQDREKLEHWLDAPEADPHGRVGADLIGSAPVFRAAMRTLRRFAKCPAPLMITGETGSGKSAAARAAHRLSFAADKPFVTLHCAAIHSESDIPDTETLDGGTLFLSDLEDLQSEAQVALLRWMQTDVNADQAQTGEAPRLMTSCTANLSSPEAGFRSNLFFRLSVLSLRLPPLRDRDGDVEELARFFADRFAEEHAQPSKPFSCAFTKALRANDWPGNVRELENFIHRACVLSTRDEICIRETGRPGKGWSSDLAQDIRPYHEAREATLRAFETAYLHKLMLASGGNVTRAARMAGTERRSLGRMLKRNDMSTGI